MKGSGDEQDIKVVETAGAAVAEHGGGATHKAPERTDTLQEAASKELALKVPDKGFPPAVTSFLVSLITVIAALLVYDYFLAHRNDKPVVVEKEIKPPVEMVMALDMRPLFVKQMTDLREGKISPVEAEQNLVMLAHWVRSMPVDVIVTPREELEKKADVAPKNQQPQ